MNFHEDIYYIKYLSKVPGTVVGVLTLFYVLISLVAIVGNLLVMYVVAVSR